MTTPILPQPPKKTDPQFDEWMFRMWKTLLGAAGGAATWSQTDKNSVVPVSEGQLKAGPHNTAAWGLVRATKGLRRGKWFWEVTVGNAAQLMIGIANSSAALGPPGYPGFDAYGFGYYSVNGNEYSNGNSAYGNSYAAGDVIGVALDMDAGTIKFYKNGTVQNSGTAAATGLTGTYFPAIGCYDAGYGMANFGAIPFAYSVPDGYSAGVI